MFTTRRNSGQNGAIPTLPPFLVFYSQGNFLRELVQHEMNESRWVGVASRMSVVVSHMIIN